MPDSPDPHLALWYSALSFPFGARYTSTDRRLTLAKLYAARAASGDSTLAALSIVLPPHSTDEFWIVKRTT